MRVPAQSCWLPAQLLMSVRIPPTHTKWEPITYMEPSNFRLLVAYRGKLVLQKLCVMQSARSPDETGHTFYRCTATSPYDPAVHDEYFDILDVWVSRAAPYGVVRMTLEMPARVGDERTVRVAEFEFTDQWTFRLAPTPLLPATERKPVDVTLIPTNTRPEYDGMTSFRRSFKSRQEWLAPPQVRPGSTDELRPSGEFEV